MHNDKGQYKADFAFLSNNQSNTDQTTYSERSITFLNPRLDNLGQHYTKYVESWTILAEIVLNTQKVGQSWPTLCKIQKSMTNPDADWSYLSCNYRKTHLLSK